MRLLLGFRGALLVSHTLDKNGELTVSEVGPRNLNLNPRAAVRARPITLRKDPSAVVTRRTARPRRVSPQVGQQAPRVPKFPSNDS